MSLKRNLGEQNKRKKISYILILSFIFFCLLLAIVLKVTNTGNSINSTNSSIASSLRNISKIAFQRDGNILPEISFDVEIADTDLKRETGLMNRSSMKDSSAMLFVFSTEEPLSFWMKNTLIPLDMIFMNIDKKVVKIYQNTLPLREDLTYKYNGMYVLEINAGLSDKLDIKEGDTMLLQSITN